MTATRLLLVGGAGGIGASIARRLAAGGATVAIADRDEPAGQTIAREIGGVFIRTDLADPPSAQHSLGAAIDALGGIDALVNSAGVFRHSPLLEIEPAEWDRVMAVNARGCLIAMQVAARAMIASGNGGRIVTIASMAAKHRGDLEAHYAASKAAVLALTRAGALEWGVHGITVNAVCPGFVLTEMGADSRTEADVAAWTALSPLGRLGTPEDVAGMVDYLLGPDGGYCTGQAFNITGGMVMH
ncbi:MAG: SDR family oxidoreductase [Microbacteriaceae bacterium]